MARPARTTIDFGMRRRSTMERKLAIWMACAGVVVLTGIYTPSIIRHRHAARVHSAAWRSVGPPCPTRPDGFTLPLANAFQIDDVLFRYSKGHVSCDTLQNHGGVGWTDYPACKFLNPGVVTVESKWGQSAFYPGLGRSVTVTVERKETRCILETDAIALYHRFF